MGVRSYQDLDVWKDGISLAVRVAEICKSFPVEERFALADQMRRAAVSVPSNIAEGQQRRYTREFVQFLHISLGSLAELRTQLEIAARMRYLDRKDFDSLKDSADHLGRRIRRLLQGLPLSEKPRTTNHEPRQPEAGSAPGGVR